MNSFARERLVVGRDHAFRVSFADRGRVGIHGVQQHLHGGGPAALQIARVVVRDHKSGIQIAVRDLLAHFVHVEIGAGALEALAFGHGRDKFAAFGSSAVVHNAEPQVADGRVESESEKKQLQRGRQDQGHGQPAVPQDLAKFLADQSPHAVTEKCANLIHDLILQLHAPHVAPRDGVKKRADDARSRAL